MKLKMFITLAALAIVIWFAASVFTDGKTEKQHEAPKGPPHGGLLIELDAVQLEFLLEPDFKARIYTYDLQRKPFAPAHAEMRLMIQGKDSPLSPIVLEQDGHSFVANAPIQVPGDARVMLSFLQGSTTNHFRFDLVLSQCPGCKQPEYRCACAE